MNKKQSSFGIGLAEFSSILPAICGFVGEHSLLFQNYRLWGRPAKGVSKPDFVPRCGARPIAGGERKVFQSLILCPGGAQDT
jgi:hypothetical protein